MLKLHLLTEVVWKSNAEAMLALFKGLSLLTQLSFLPRISTHSCDFLLLHLLVKSTALVDQMAPQLERRVEFGFICFVSTILFLRACSTCASLFPLFTIQALVFDLPNYLQYFVVQGLVQLVAAWSMLRAPYLRSVGAVHAADELQIIFFQARQAAFERYLV